MAQIDRRVRVSSLMVRCQGSIASLSEADVVKQRAALVEPAATVPGPAG
jgi:hypothetical protein